MTGFFSPQFLISAVLISAVIFVNGWTDAPNAVATCVGSGVLPMRRAINMAAVFNFLGLAVMVALNDAVAQNISTSFTRGENAHTVLCAAMIAIVAFAVGAWYFGVPTSESHALVAALSGAAAAEGGIRALSLPLLLSTLIGLFITCFIGAILGFCGKKVLEKSALNQKKRLLARIEVLSAALLSFIHGAQDGQKFSAVMVYAVYLWLPKNTVGKSTVTLFCALLLALGTAVGGKRIIKKVGSGITAVDEGGGVCCDTAAFISILICTLLGMPVSTTHTKTCAILGVGAANRKINPKPIYEIFSLWLLTFPVCFIIGYLITRLCI